MDYPQDHFQTECPFKEVWASEEDLKQYKQRPYPVTYNIDWEKLYQKHITTKMSYAQLAKSTGTDVSVTWVHQKLLKIRKEKNEKNNQKS